MINNMIDVLIYYLYFLIRKRQLFNLRKNNNKLHMTDIASYKTYLGQKKYCFELN